MASSLEIDVALQVAPSVAHPVGLAPNTKHAFPLKEDTKSANAAAYYAALSAAIHEAKSKTGDELTRWRDAAAASESGKEPKAKPDDDDEEEEDSEEDA